MIFLPNWRSHARKGIGSAKQMYVPKTKHVLFSLVLPITLSGRIPYHLNLSEGYQIDKQNWKSGALAVRVIHVFCGLLKDLLSFIGPRP